MVTSFRMISATTVRRIIRSTRSDALTFVLTAVVTVCFDLIEAVEIGVVVAAVFALRSVARRSSVTREELPGPTAPVTSRSRCSAGRRDVLRRRRTHFDHDRRRRAPEVSVVIIRMSQLGMLDATGAHTLARIATS